MVVLDVVDVELSVIFIGAFVVVVVVGSVVDVYFVVELPFVGGNNVGDSVDVVGSMSAGVIVAVVATLSG